MSTCRAASELHGLAERVQHWRRSVVRAWIIAMIAALAAWSATAAWPMTSAAQTWIGAGLVLLLAYACWNMRRGRCPNCSGRIRFEPRIELPKRCANCGVPFALPSDDERGR